MSSMRLLDLLCSLFPWLQRCLPSQVQQLPPVCSKSCSRSKKISGSSNQELVAALATVWQIRIGGLLRVCKEGSGHCVGNCALRMKLGRALGCSGLKQPWDLLPSFSGWYYCLSQLVSGCRCFSRRKASTWSILPTYDSLTLQFIT